MESLSLNSIQIYQTYLSYHMLESVPVSYTHLKYAESDNFEILLFGVSIDGGKVQVFDLACGDIIPDDILATLSDDTVTKLSLIHI